MKAESSILFCVALYITASKGILPLVQVYTVCQVVTMRLVGFFAHEYVCIKSLSTLTPTCILLL